MWQYKYAVKISYTGTNYAGWQRQPDAISVQQRVEEALFRLGEDSAVTGAGRTDAGVHALGQVASFGAKKFWQPGRLLLAMNSHLPADIRVMDVRAVSENFDARRNALWREYRYFIYHGSSCLAPLRPFVWWNKFAWDFERVREACRFLVGTHDFRAFCKATECPKNSERTILRACCKRVGSLSVVQVRGESFLNNMVRIIVGNLDAIGRGERSVDWFKSLFVNGGRNRKCSGLTAPAAGLFFWKVGYADVWN